jgi:hypothetical protein
VSSDIPSTSAASHVAMLRRAWLEVAASAAPDLTDLPGLLDERLTSLEAAGVLDEPTLLAVAEESSQYALEHGAGDVARTLSKRLRRAIYEFLLALDAVNPLELGVGPVALTPPAAVPEPRTPVAFMPADVPGADEPAAVPVPMWEATAPPPVVREVYRVATRDVEPRDGAAAVLDEMAAAPEGVGEEFADVEAVSDTAEAQLFDAQEHAADVVEALAEAEAAEAWDEPAATSEIAEEQLAAEAHDDRAVEAADAEPLAAMEIAEDEPVAEAPEWGETAAATQDEPAVEADVVAAADLDAGAAAQYEPIAEASASDETIAAVQDEPAAEAHFEPAAETTAAVEDEAAVEAHFDPAAETTAAVEDEPAAEAHFEPAAEVTAAVEDEPVIEAHFEPAAETTAAVEDEAAVEAHFEPAAEITVETPAELPDAEADNEPQAAAHVEPVAAEWTPPTDDAPDPADTRPAAPHAPTTNGAKPPRDMLRVPRQFRRLTPLAARHHGGNGGAATPEAAPEPTDDDSFGVPSIPWMVQQPQPEHTPEPAPQPAAEHDDPDEDMGVPFGPFALASEPATPAAAGLEPADLPRPPALAEEPLHPLPGADHLFITPLPSPDSTPALWTPGPVPTPSYAMSASPGEPFPIAPLEGFHLIDPGELPASASPFITPAEAGTPLPPTAPAAAADAPEAAPQPAPTTTSGPPSPDHELHDDGSWRIRQSPRAQLLAERMAQKRREEAAAAAFDAAAYRDEERGRGRKRRHAEEAIPDLPTARRQLDEHLRRKRGAEAGALLQRLAQQLGGREIADLALDSGDRCRALGQSRSATNCYLAAWRADPLYETPLWRLSDICLNDQEIELAVGYLERIAELMRSRSDDEGAIGVYRKIAMIAPERQDVRDVIRLAKTTGRLDG